MSGPISTTGGYSGHASLADGASEFNGLDFLVRQVMAGKAFAALVKVLTVTGGGVGAPPTVSVQPMVNQVDGLGNQVPHGTVYSLPCFRLQGGAGAVILDPVPGDIGEAIICDRDISVVKKTGKVSGPGSFRQHDWADGCYFGSFLGPTPTVFVQIGPAGISIAAPGHAVAITSATLTHNGVNIGSTHVHSDPQGGSTGGPS